MKLPSLILAIVLAFAAPLRAATWYVSPGGNDGNAGTAPTSAFLTIQHAANVAKAGDTVAIAGGVFRETVKPVSNGVTFQGAGAGQTVVSGCGPTPTDLGEGMNQVFATAPGGVETQVPEASVSGTVKTAKLSQSGANSGTSITVTITDPARMEHTGYWVGATIRVGSGQVWVRQSFLVTASSPGSLTFTGVAEGSVWNDVAATNPYMLTGPMIAPGPGQCTISGANVVLGTLPVGSTVEYKARALTFDLRGHSNTTISNLTTFVGNARDNPGDSGNVVKNCECYYLSWQSVLSNGWSNTTTGLVFNGNSDTAQDTLIKYSSGNGILLGGKNSVVQRCTISEVDQAAGDDAGILLLGSGHKVSYCTIYDAARDGIKGSNCTGWDVDHCVGHDVMQQTTDGGFLYTYGNINNATWMNNVAYSIHAGGYLADAWYLDNNSQNVTITGCLAYDVDNAAKFNVKPVGVVYQNNSDSQVTNSTTGSQANWAGLKLIGNVFSGALQTSGATLSNNYQGSPYVNAAAGNFAISPTSPAAKMGVGASFPFPCGDPNTYAAPSPSTQPTTQPTTQPIKPNPPVPDTRPSESLGAILYGEEQAASDRKAVALTALPAAVEATAKAEVQGTTNDAFYYYTVSGTPWWSAHFTVGGGQRIAVYFAASGAVVRKFDVPAGSS
jgi:Right handed beta helix region